MNPVGYTGSSFPWSCWAVSFYGPEPDAGPFSFTNVLNNSIISAICPWWSWWAFSNRFILASLYFAIFCLRSSAVSVTNHLFLRIRGFDIRLNILARIIQLLLKAKAKRAHLSWLPNRLAKLWVTILFLPLSLIIIYFTTYRPFHWLTWNVKCMDNDARMQIEMMSWMQSNKQENNHIDINAKACIVVIFSKSDFCFSKIGTLRVPRVGKSS